MSHPRPGGRASTVRAALAFDLMTTREAARLATGGTTAFAVDPLPDLSGDPAPWSGVLVLEGDLTGDGRLIEANALRWENLPIPLRYAPVDNGGHDGAQVVGTIDTIERVGRELRATGRYDTGSDIGREAYRHVVEGLTTGVSVDLDDVSFEVRVASEVMEALDALWAEEPTEGEPEQPAKDAEGRITVASIGSDDEVMVVTDARVRAATQVAIPAFERARLSADAPAAPVPAPEAGAPLAAGTATFEVEQGDRVTWLDGETSREGVVQSIDGATAVVLPDDAEEPVEVPLAELTEVDDDDAQQPNDPPPAEQQPAQASAAALVAGAGPVRPPAAWFRDPGLSEPTALTVTDDGRVYGHLALWGTCHIGYSGQCVSPPSSQTNYAYFRTGAVVTDDGAEVAVGPITLDTLHASTSRGMTATQAARHYEDTGRAVAYIAAGEDEYGVWVAGAVRADASEEQVRALRASPLSGDWRRIGAELELVAALAVNLPGFPVPRTKALVASGHVQSLVAAGMLPPREVIAPGQPGALSTEDLRYLRNLAARERERERLLTPAEQAPDPMVRLRLTAVRRTAAKRRGYAGAKTTTTA